MGEHIENTAEETVEDAYLLHGRVRVTPFLNAAMQL